MCAKGGGQTSSNRVVVLLHFPENVENVLFNQKFHSTAGGVLLKGGRIFHTHSLWLQYMEWFSNSNSVLKAKSKMGTFILALSRYSIEMVLWSGSLQERAALDFCLSTRRFWGRPQFYSLLTDNRLDQLSFLLDVESFLKIVSSNLNSSQTTIFHDS